MVEAAQPKQLLFPLTDIVRPRPEFSDLSKQPTLT